MRFTEHLRRLLGLRGGVAASSAALIAACSTPAPAPAPAPASAVQKTEPPRTGAAAPATGAATTVATAAPAARPALPPPDPARSWTQVRLQAAHRMLLANPDLTYASRAPDPLLAIPVLEIELNRDGSVRHIEVLRQPRQARDTVAIATAAVHRAAPFGDVSRLPRPWKFVETFLFDDARRFKPRILED